MKETEIAILQCLKINSEKTANNISEKTSVTKRTIQRYFNLLKKKGYVVREGSKTKGKWIVLKSPKEE